MEFPSKENQNVSALFRHSNFQIHSKAVLSVNKFIGVVICYNLFTQFMISALKMEHA